MTSADAGPGPARAQGMQYPAGLLQSRILMIDDEPVNLKLLERTLKLHGFSELLSLQDPRQALASYLEYTPDIVLLDINMPYIDGFGVLEQIQSLPPGTRPPILILTAQGSKDRLTRAFDLGARDFLQKPFDIAELIARVRNLLELHHAQRHVREQNEQLEHIVQLRTRQLRETQLQIVRRLGRAAEYRDNETGNHIVRMSHTSSMLARELGKDEEFCELLMNASPMHDIGKIGIPDGILLKPGKLTPDEWEIMKTHVTIGASILSESDSPLLDMASEIALNHHEKWDGSGYPSGLSGEQIPLVGRIVAVADVFDALTSERPYKKPWPMEEAVNFMKEQSGLHFDARVVDALMAVLPRVIEIRNSYSDSYDPELLD
jgi:putative two-component system response regulator